MALAWRWRGVELAFYWDLIFLLAYSGGQGTSYARRCCQCLQYCSMSIVGQFPAPPESAAFCCIFMCAPVHVLVVLLCFMLWAFWLTSEPPVPRHPTSMCDSDVERKVTGLQPFFQQFFYSCRKKFSFTIIVPAFSNTHYW